MWQKKTENKKNSNLASKKDHQFGSLVRRFIASESGTTAIEYALIAGGVSIVIISSGLVLGGHVKAIFETIRDAIVQ